MRTINLNDRHHVFQPDTGPVLLPPPALDDVALPPANLEGLDEVIDDLTIEKVTGCGHFVSWESPAKVNAAMDAFLRRTA